MPNPSSDPNADRSAPSPEAPLEENELPSWGDDDATGMPDGLSSSLVQDMARSWVQRHQKATMLGAFGVGVFVGAVLRG